MGAEKFNLLAVNLFYWAINFLNWLIVTKNKGYYFVEVFTNGMLVEEKQIDFLVKHNVSVAVSFYGPNSHIHNQVTLNNYSFDRTVNNLKNNERSRIKDTCRIDNHGH